MEDSADKFPHYEKYLLSCKMKLENKIRGYGVNEEIELASLCPGSYTWVTPMKYEKE